MKSNQEKKTEQQPKKKKLPWETPTIINMTTTKELNSGALANHVENQQTAGCNIVAAKATMASTAPTIANHLNSPSCTLSTVWSNCGTLGGKLGNIRLITGGNAPTLNQINCS